MRIVLWSLAGRWFSVGNWRTLWLQRRTGTLTMNRLAETAQNALGLKMNSIYFWRIQKTHQLVRITDEGWLEATILTVSWRSMLPLVIRAMNTFLLLESSRQLTIHANLWLKSWGCKVNIKAITFPYFSSFFLHVSHWALEPLGKSRRQKQHCFMADTKN